MRTGPAARAPLVMGGLIGGKTPIGPGRMQAAPVAGQGPYALHNQPFQCPVSPRFSSPLAWPAHSTPMTRVVEGIDIFKIYLAVFALLQRVFETLDRVGAGLVLDFGGPWCGLALATAGVGDLSLPSSLSMMSEGGEAGSGGTGGGRGPADEFRMIGRMAEKAAQAVELEATLATARAEIASLTRQIEKLKDQVTLGQQKAGGLEARGRELVAELARLKATVVATEELRSVLDQLGPVRNFLEVLAKSSLIQGADTVFATASGVVTRLEELLRRGAPKPAEPEVSVPAGGGDLEGEPALVEVPRGVRFGEEAIARSCSTLQGEFPEVPATIIGNILHRVNGRPSLRYESGLRDSSRPVLALYMAMWPKIDSQIATIDGATKEQRAQIRIEVKKAIERFYLDGKELRRLVPANFKKWIAGAVVQVGVEATPAVVGDRQAPELDEAPRPVEVPVTLEQTLAVRLGIDPQKFTTALEEVDRRVQKFWGDIGTSGRSSYDGDSWGEVPKGHREKTPVERPLRALERIWEGSLSPPERQGIVHAITDALQVQDIGRLRTFMGLLLDVEDRKLGLPHFLKILEQERGYRNRLGEYVQGVDFYPPLRAIQIDRGRNGFGAMSEVAYVSAMATLHKTVVSVATDLSPMRRRCDFVVDGVLVEVKYLPVSVKLSVSELVGRLNAKIESATSQLSQTAVDLRMDKAKKKIVIFLPVTLEGAEKQEVIREIGQSSQRLGVDVEIGAIRFDDDQGVILGLEVVAIAEVAASGSPSQALVERSSLPVAQEGAAASVQGIHPEAAATQFEQPLPPVETGTDAVLVGRHQKKAEKMLRRRLGFQFPYHGAGHQKGRATIGNVRDFVTDLLRKVDRAKFSNLHSSLMAFKEREGLLGKQAVEELRGYVAECLRLGILT